MSAALVDLEAIRARHAAGKPVRRALTGGGRLHIDRELPFLCVHRSAPGQPDDGAAEMVRTQASYLTARGDPALHGELARLVRAVVEALADACGACLLLEIWTGAATDGPATFRIRTPSADRLATTVAALAEALRAMVTPAGRLTVEVGAGGDASPPGMLPLVEPAVAAHAGYLVIGLEVPPIYRVPGRSATAVYPMVLRALAGELARALQRGFFEFTRVQTLARPEHYHMMGRRYLVRSVREADRALGEIETSFDFLLDVTPVNTEEAWDEFCRSGRKEAPVLRYRMLTVDPELGKRRLYDLPLERLEDPALALLLREKRREIDRQLGLLEERDTPRFLPGSIALYGGVDDALLAEALALLAALPPAPAAPALCGADALARRARLELEHYRRLHPALSSVVHLRDDIPSLIVSHGDLLIPRQLAVSDERVEALVQHEIGTHVVTYVNGRAQPLHVLAGGLTGYESLQEGLALLAEYLVGGLDANRLRLIAARTVAVRRMIDGVTFPAVVAELCDHHRIPPRAAFGVTIRVFRGGGLTKDAIYLRGLLQLLDHLAAGGALEPLLVGKIALEHAPMIEELTRRQILRSPLLRPRWLEGADAADRLARLRAGKANPRELVDQVDQAKGRSA